MASVAEAEGKRDSAADDPYAEFNAAVSASTAGVYKGPMKAFGGGPDAVAKVIEKAISSRRPKPRYLVTPSARTVHLRGLMPDRVWDAAMRAQFKPPGKSK